MEAMSLNASQFEALFINAFGDGSSAFGIEIDSAGDVAIGRKGSHTIELIVVQQRAIEWRVDGAMFIPWRQHPKDDPARQGNGTALRNLLA